MKQKNVFARQLVKKFPFHFFMPCFPFTSHLLFFLISFLFPGGPRINEATVVYNNSDQAVYAREKLHGFEYPPGERLIVRLLGNDSSVSGFPSFGNDDQGSRRSNRYCSVDLPDPQPLANPNATCAQRCFIVFSKVSLRFVFIR